MPGPNAGGAATRDTGTPPTFAITYTCTSTLVGLAKYKKAIHFLSISNRNYTIFQCFSIITYFIYCLKKMHY